MAAGLLRRFGRRLRLGMVGGGPGSWIGEAHRMAARLDNRYELVAGSFSANPARGREAGAELLLPPDRCYEDYRRMADAEAGRSDGIEVVTICTPPESHHAIASEFLRRGVEVICDKPMTATLEQSIDLVRLVRETGRWFCLTHNYTGYPMVRQARAMIADGALGAVRLVQAEFPIGTAGMVAEEPDPKQRHWRFDPARAGKAGLLGEVGSHAHHLARFVTGLEITALSARMATFAPGRNVYDNATLSVTFDNGAQSTFWSSYVAAGNEHGLSLRVHGEKGGLAWRQEQPNELWHMPLGEPMRRLSTGQPGLAPAAMRASRLVIGHPGGFIDAFANLYRDFADVVMATRLGIAPDPQALLFPRVEDGARGLKMIETAAASQAQGGAWVDATLAL
jgi:predicted dehydrogenase